MAKMIPKIIHYIWFGGNEKPAIVKECLNSWKKYLKDYEIIEWNETNFDIDSHPYVKDAIERRKYAFASDYVRMWILNKYGGIYLDTDILLFRSLTPLLENTFFSAKEIFKDDFEKFKESHTLSEGKLIDSTDYVAGFGVMSAIMGSIPNHIFTKEILDYYDSLLPDSRGVYKNPIIDGVLAKKLESRGFLYIDDTQKLEDGITLYSSENFMSGKRILIKEAYCFHCCDNSWNDDRLNKKIIARFKLYTCKIIWKLQKFILP